MVKLLISVAYWILSTLFRSLMVLFGTRRRPFQSVVLCYHSVPQEHQRRFARQMDHLLKAATPLSPADLHLQPGVNKSVLVTFDDGLLNFRIFALPELIRRRIPVALFVPSSFLGKSPTFSTWYGSQSDAIVMTAEEIRALPADLVVIGSHSQTHPHLSALDHDTAWKEIAYSKEALEALLGKPITLFAFPYGDYNDHLVPLCRQAGYQHVFISLPIGTGDFLCGRIDTDPTDWPIEFMLKVRGAYCWLPQAVALKRKIKVLMRPLGLSTC